MKITKRSAYSALAGVGVLMGAAGISAAATGSDATPAPAAVAQQADPTVDPDIPVDDESAEDSTAESNEGIDDDANEGPENEAENGAENEADDGNEDEGTETPPDYTSSVQTTPEDESAEAEDAETDASEAEEEAALAALATVTPDEASAAALTAQPGTVEEVELENEAGNVVYEVEIVDANGVEMEVIIDAGDGDVLAIEAD